MKNMHFPESNKRRCRDRGEWWPNLIKSQLNNGWPVLYLACVTWEGYSVTKKLIVK